MSGRSFVCFVRFEENIFTVDSLVAPGAFGKRPQKALLGDRC